MASWPWADWNNNRFIVRIQQDGPSSHILPDDEGFLEGLTLCKLLLKKILMIFWSNIIMTL